MKELFIVGIGPGSFDQMTIEAGNVLQECDLVIGYTVYVELVKPYFPDKEYLTTGMRQEKERCHMALQEAEKGKRTALICSGDAGVYGMAGILLELWADYPEVDIHVIPGVTAALSGGAVLGAPLGHDFAVISLSDLLIPWEKIEQRLKGAAMADFVICLYNPSSRQRKDYLQRACDILLKEKSGQTVCGYVRNIGRQGESCQILSLSELRDTQVDMFTTVFIGNSQTKQVMGKMVTPRGYERQVAAQCPQL